MVVMSARAVNRATLARQLLVERAEVGVSEAVGRLVGMQGQEAKHPYVGLWSRVVGFARGRSDRAVEAREVVRGTLFRGTLHLVTAADYLRFRTTVAPVLEAGLRLLKERAEGMEPAKVVASAERILAKEPLTFTEVRDALAEGVPRR